VHARIAAALVLSAALVLLPGALRAQDSCSPATSTRTWTAPLDRRIAIRARDVSLREALDRIAAAARFRVSYSGDFLPLDRHVCLTTDSVAAGEALSAVLSGVEVLAVPTASDQVVIAPAKPREPAPRESVQTLERVVVTGSANGGAQRSLGIALDVLDGHTLTDRSAGTFTAALDGSVPGLWLWDQGASSPLARYGSIRGTSSFGVSYPKIYIDGIEVANPLLLTDMNPAVIDRIEVIRGPQGAALYGADAISGVINILTRHEGTQAGAPRTEINSGAGFTASQYADRASLAQNHSFTLRAGSSMRSATASMNLTTLGGYVPQAYSQDLRLNGGFRVVTSTASVTGTARFSGKRAAAGENPLLRGFLSSQPAPAQGPAYSRGSSRAEDSGAATANVMVADSLPQSVSEYTLGSTATLLTGTKWTPSFTLGLDGYRLKNLPNDLAVVPSALDTAIADAQGGADRMSVRASLVGQFEIAARRALTLTFSAEHSTLREELLEQDGTSNDGSEIRYRNVANWLTNTGVVGQANVAIDDAWYLTGGLRIERNDGFTVSQKPVALPMIGTAFVRDFGLSTVKLRAAYGVGIRPARSLARDAALRDPRQLAMNAMLDPERQEGIEFGADFFHSERFALHVTRFDQTAKNLIQAVGVARDSIPVSSGGPGPSKRIAYVLQNVGEISNKGWELESSVGLGSFTLAGALSTVDSRVRRIARGYTGDLVVGGRTLAVPAATASLSIGWHARAWRTSLTASRAMDWINYDRLRLTEDYAGCTGTCNAADWTGEHLRSYWMNYDGVTRLRGTFARDLPRNLGLSVTVDNITNVQRNEPDNLTVLPGRTVLFGLTAKIR
jgi:iron complex outermembrane receptor protein